MNMFASRKNHQPPLHLHLLGRDLRAGEEPVSSGSGSVITLKEMKPYVINGKENSAIIVNIFMRGTADLGKVRRIMDKHPEYASGLLYYELITKDKAGDGAMSIKKYMGRLDRTVKVDPSKTSTESDGVKDIAMAKDEISLLLIHTGFMPINYMEGAKRLLTEMAKSVDNEITTDCPLLIPRG